VNFSSSFTVSVLTPTTAVSSRANCSARSRKPHASAVQPPVRALGKK
jgi:hypothetical protein